MAAFTVSGLVRGSNCVPSVDRYDEPQTEGEPRPSVSPSPWDPVVDAAATIVVIGPSRADVDAAVAGVKLRSQSSAVPRVVVRCLVVAGARAQFDDYGDLLRDNAVLLLRGLDAAWAYRAAGHTAYPDVRSFSDGFYAATMQAGAGLFLSNGSVRRFSWWDRTPRPQNDVPPQKTAGGDALPSPDRDSEDDYYPIDRSYSDLPRSRSEDYDSAYSDGGLGYPRSSCMWD